VIFVGLDVDGVLTNGRKLYTGEGFSAMEFDARDGLGIHLLLGAGIEVAIVTNTDSEIVSRRAADLGVTRLLQGVTDKGAAVRRILAEANVAKEQALFVGDDIWDIPAFEEVGIPVAVNGAHEVASSAAVWVTENMGGRGAVREVADAILQAKAFEWRVALGLQAQLNA
jgi:3-deoxy-D-manno-octulosonate 8-phosphate phosphatase (KDO 8-P phosphatase)